MACGLTKPQHTSVCQAANIGSEGEKTFGTGRVDLFWCLQNIHAAHVQGYTLEHQLPVSLTMFPGKGRIFEQFLACHILKLFLHV